MLVPRQGHNSFSTASGDIVVVGGHTTNFTLTKTAERLHNGQWESILINNSHDDASLTTLPDGRVLICGGFGGSGGNGSCANCDIYDPLTNTFSSTGNLVTMRASCNGIATGIGNNVLLSGNWYGNDRSFELWDGSTWTSFGSKPSEESHPLMASDAQGTVYVFGFAGKTGNSQALVVYQVNTVEKTFVTISVPSLDGYSLMVNYSFFGSDPVSSQTEDNDRLFLATKNQDIDLVRFDVATATASKLTTLPSNIPGLGNAINYSYNVFYNKSRKEAYVTGYYTVSGGKALVVVNYNLETGETILYHGGMFALLEFGDWTLQTNTGYLVLTGGLKTNNNDPVNTAIIIKPYISRGDVNMDGLVDINDVTLLIDVVLGKPVSYNAAAADCNIEGGDGLVDINDVTTLISHVLTGNWE